MSINPVLAEKHMKDAAARAEASRELFQQESGENRQAYERFYNSLALFSGGTVALSVTYLGYLKSLSKPPVHPRWLVGSWGCLLFCVAISLFCTFFNTHYMHFARLREHTENMKRKRIAEAEAIDPLKPVNLTHEQRLGFEEKLRKAAAAFEETERWAARRESIYLFLWIWGGRSARLAFLVGFGLLFCFAVSNI